MVWPKHDINVMWPNVSNTTYIKENFNLSYIVNV